MNISYEEIVSARKVLTKAFKLFTDGKLGANGQDDPAGICIEAKRNLTALVKQLHGDAAFEKILTEDN